MAKFGPVYMSVYDGPDYALVDLTLSADTFTANAAQGTAIGSITGTQDAVDSSLSLADDAGGKVQLSGANLQVGANPSSAGTFNVTVRETNIYGTNNPHDTVFAITAS